MGIERAIQEKFGKFKKSKGKHGLEYIVSCPFCKRKDKMYINPVQGVFLCFRCGETGSNEDLLGRQLNVKGNASSTTVPPLPSNVVLPGNMVPLTDLDDNHPAITYLRRRKFDPRYLNDAYGVRYCSSGRTFAEIYDTTSTLVFPLWMDKQLIGWQSRLLYNPDDLTDDECGQLGLKKDEDGDYVKPPKYWTSPGLPKGRILFNFDWARTGDLVVLCEGVFDAISVGRCAVAALGKGVSPQQIDLLRYHWPLVVLLLDPDANEDAKRIAVHFQSGIAKTIRVELQGYKDAGEAPKEEIWLQIGRAARRQGIDLFKYRFII